MRTALAITCLLLLPGVAAEASPVTLYAHIGGFQEFAMNTQEPEARYVAMPNAGLAMQSNCIQDPSGSTAFTDQQHHTWYSYSSPGFVEYDVDENGRPRIHQERGLGSDMRLDQNGTFYWYVAGEGQPTMLPVAPQAYLRVTIREGDDVSVGNEALNIGSIIARGQTEPVTLAPGVATDEVTHHQVDGRDVYAFRVALAYEDLIVDAAEAFNVRVDLWQDLGYCDGDEGANYADLQPFQAPGMWNRWELMVHDPLRIDYLIPQLVGDDLVIHGAAASVFGNYDIAAGGNLTVWDEAGHDVSDLFDLVDLVARWHEHDHKHDPLTQTWIANTTRLDVGIYTGRMEVWNLQGTANASAEFAFQLQGDLCGTTPEGYGCMPASIDEESPALTVPLLGLALLLLARRR